MGCGRRLLPLKQTATLFYKVSIFIDNLNMHTISDEFSLPFWEGEPQDFPYKDTLLWVKKLQNNVYCYFYPTWNDVDNLPDNYEYYIILYHNETLINLEWLESQRKKVDGTFVVLHNGFNYDYNLKNCHFFRYINWHENLKLMEKIWGAVEPKFDNKKYKFSAVCNRVEQFKIFIITKLLEECRDDSHLVLNNWLEDKNVNYWLPLSDNLILDNLTNTFKRKYLNTVIKDSFGKKLVQNTQRYNSNPYQPMYTDTAIHFSLQNFSMSQYDNFIHPGPEIDEKIFKCLLSGTPFIPCGQFDIINSLRKLGFVFDYKFIDLSFDNLVPEDERFESICKQIDNLKYLTINDIISDTKKSTMENWKYIIRGGFFENCERINKNTEEKILDLIVGKR